MTEATCVTSAGEAVAKNSTKGVEEDAGHSSLVGRSSGEARKDSVQYSSSEEDRGVHTDADSDSDCDSRDPRTERRKEEASVTPL